MVLIRCCSMILLCIFVLIGCKERLAQRGAVQYRVEQVNESTEHPAQTSASRGALLLSQFNSFDELKEVIEFEYSSKRSGLTRVQCATIRQKAGDREVESELCNGIDQSYFHRAFRGSLWDKARVALKSPYALVSRNGIMEVEILARRRPRMFGEGDPAFYDIAENMVFRIDDESRQSLGARDLSEKGYLNTFNHVTAQAFITSIYSEELADFIADVHERFAMPELITGVFTDEQLADLETGPLDNYLDIINNEWGQELGKELREKYGITRDTYWTPELLADYLNDIQAYHSWVFGIGFEPFRTSDDIIIRFAAKLNAVLTDFEALTSGYYKPQ